MNAPLPDVPEVRVVGLPQLTQGFDLVERLDLSMHLKVHGPLEPLTGELLAQLAENITLRGRGGAGFPFGKKLRAVDAMETEQASELLELEDLAGVVPGEA